MVPRPTWWLMKTLIKHAETNLFLGRSNKWVKDPQQAMDFLDEVRARDYCIYRRLAKAVVVALPDPRSVEPAPAVAPAVPPTENRHDLEIENMKPKAVRNTTVSKAKVLPAVGRATTPAPAAPKAVASETAKKPNTAKPVVAKTVSKPVAPVIPAAKPVTAAPVTAVAAPEKAVVASPSARPVVTSVAAKIDVGFGNSLFIRGQGDGLSWDKGTPLQCVDASTWIWSTTGARGSVVFKLLINDELWSQGEDLVVQAGQKAEVEPVF